MPYSFSEQGVAAMMSDLYALSDQELEIEAGAAAADFKSWVAEKFTLDANQSGYLDGISEEWAVPSGNLFAVALRHRLPVVLTKPTVILPDDYSSKIIRTESTIVVSYNDVAGAVAEGGLTFAIALEP